MTKWNPYDHHRGPYRLHVLRATPNRKVKWHTEWLPGAVERDDIESEVQALLADPRDTITSIFIWSDKEEMFVMTYREGDVK